MKIESPFSNDEVYGSPGNTYRSRCMDGRKRYFIKIMTGILVAVLVIAAIVIAIVSSNSISSIGDNQNVRDTVSNKVSSYDLLSNTKIDA